MGLQSLITKQKYFIECGNHVHNFQSLEHQDNNRNIFITKNGKEAINLLLSHLKLSPEDEVLIVSSLNTKYVSKCVTCSIFNHAKPSKVFSKSTKLIYLIHDHGFPLKSFEKYKALSETNNIPIVEDCAHSITSKYQKENTRNIGTVGHYIVYSFRKIFPIDLGGLGFSNEDEYANFKKSHQEKSNRFIFNLLAHRSDFHNTRVSHYKHLLSLTENSNKVLKIFDENIPPYCFSIIHKNPDLFKNSFMKISEDLFECVTWYNLPLVSFPCHQLIPHNAIKKLGTLINQTSNLLKK